MYPTIKRLLDSVFAAALLAVLLPCMGGIALALAVDRPGRILFLQPRVGKNDKIFTIYKFRTISVKTDKTAAPAITPFCAFLRAWSLDELPQLWNILVGDMSFVGPRPVITAEKELLRLRELHYATTVRPGLTGWAQINGRDNLRVNKKAFMDGYYARHATFLFDLQILAKTVMCVVRSTDVVDGHAVQEADIRILLNHRTAS